MGEGVQQATGWRLQHPTRITAGMGSRNEKFGDNVRMSSIILIEALNRATQKGKTKVIQFLYFIGLYFLSVLLTFI
jgi:hypothetical protein